MWVGAVSPGMISPSMTDLGRVLWAQLLNRGSGWGVQPGFEHCGLSALCVFMATFTARPPGSPVPLAATLLPETACLLMTFMPGTDQIVPTMDGRVQPPLGGGTAL